MDAFVLNIRIPDSRLPYPAGPWNRLKWFFWKTISPGYLFGMNVLLSLHIIRHEGRQNFIIGKLSPGTNVDDFVLYLHRNGWGNHFIAWNDDDQIVSVRKLVNFEWQYHLRVFKDGEVRGHYEYTPEAHPRWHSLEVRWEARRDDFLNFVGDWVVPAIC